MKKTLIIILIVLITIIALGVIFFTVDYNRVKKQETPIFCFKNPAGAINDGGTIEYFGLGYKVIDFNTLGGYDEIKIGTWFMKYEDFNEEKKDIENKKRLEEIEKQNYPTFLGKIIESNSTYIIVEPFENEEVRRSADKIYISLGENNDSVYEVGANVKITYTGFILETYPAKIDLVNIEVNSNN